MGAASVAVATTTLPPALAADAEPVTGAVEAGVTVDANSLAPAVTVRAASLPGMACVTTAKGCTHTLVFVTCSKQ